MGSGGSGFANMLLKLAIVGAVTVVAVVGGLAATPAAAETSLRVEAGYAGIFVPGSPLPVRVQVRADRLLAGEIHVSVDGGAPTVAPIEVPGGSEKQFLVVVPTERRGRNGATVNVRFPDGSKSPPTATGAVRPLVDEELVGLLPGALGGRGLPAAAPLMVDAGTARFVALGTAELDRAPDSLATLGTIGAGPEDLGNLPAAAREAVARWVEAGGRLLVDAEPGAPVAGVPQAWRDAWPPPPSNPPGQNTGTDRFAAGLGEVRFTRGAMAQGQWAGLIEPTPREPNPTGVQFGGPAIGDSLARDAGFRPPQASWLVAFLAIYVAVVGPGLYLLLRRRQRPELAWVAIPLVAVVFAATSYVGGRSLRHATELVHGTILGTGPSGSTASTYLGLFSRSGGDVRLTFPSGWLADPGDRQRDGSALSRVTLTPEGPEGRIPLDPGQFGVVAARGPAPAPGGLEITATSAADGQARGTIRNATRFPIDGAAVFVGAAGTQVGPLAPGAEQEWATARGPRDFRGGPPPEFLIWGRGGDRFGGAPDDGGDFNLALWDLAQRSGLANREPGRAVAVGWTREFSPPVRVGGRPVRPSGQTMVIGHSPVEPDGAAALADVSIRREIVRGVSSSNHFDGGVVSRTVNDAAAVLRFALPVGRSSPPPALAVRTFTKDVEMWTGDAWKTLPCGAPCDALDQFAGCPPGVPCRVKPGFGGFGPVPVPTPPPPPGAPAGAPAGAPPATVAAEAQVAVAVGPEGIALADVPLPPEAVREGVVYLRFPGGLAFDGPFDVLPTLKQAP